MKTIVYLILALALAVLVLAVTGCASRFYEGGQLTAEIRGDYTYQRAKDGSETITLKHSPVITAAGKAATETIVAAGTSITAFKVIK